MELLETTSFFSVMQIWRFVDSSVYIGLFNHLSDSSYSMQSENCCEGLKLLCVLQILVWLNWNVEPFQQTLDILHTKSMPPTKQPAVRAEQRQQS